MKRDTVFALGMLALTGVFFAETFNFPEGSRFTVGPAIYPRYVLAILGGLSALLLVRSLVGRDTDQPIHLASIDWSSAFATYWRTVAIFGGFALYAGLLPTLGFPIATVAFLMGLQYILTPVPRPAVLPSVR